MGVDTCADLLQVNPRTIRTWEVGSTLLTAYTAYRLLRALRTACCSDWTGVGVDVATNVWPGHLVP